MGWGHRGDTFARYVSLWEDGDLPRYSDAEVVSAKNPRPPAGKRHLGALSGRNQAPQKRLVSRLRAQFLGI